MLFCKFASPRSGQRQIRMWIEYLNELEGRNVDNLDALQTVRNLRIEAAGWLQGVDGTSHSEA